MKHPVFRRICSALLGAVLALPLLTSGMPVGGEEEESNPRLDFQNEKYEGIKIFKNIYSVEEYFKDPAERKPIRELNPEPGDLYDINDLGYDEFRLVLYGANVTDDLFDPAGRPPLTNVRYRRKLGSLLYYNIKGNQTVGGTAKDLIIAPYDISDYFLYYSNGDGTVNVVFDSRTDSEFLTWKTSEDTAQAQQYRDYLAATYIEKFRMDGAYYSGQASSPYKALFSKYSLADSEFYTDAQDGSFFIFDGDITYFDRENLQSVKYIRVRETWDFLRDINAKRKAQPDSDQYTGEYLYMIGEDVLSDVTAAAQSGLLEVANRFDTPTHELTVSKNVSFFGVGTSDVNPFRTADLFEYKLVINGRVPESLQYVLRDTKTNEIRPTAENAGEENVVKVGDSYRYVTEDGTFYLYADESATFYGVKSRDTVEIREYTEPDRYSVVSHVTDGAVFDYVKAADSTETPPRDYASITVVYGDELNQRLNPTFINVPNVIQVRKRVQETVIDTERAFAFTIQKLLPDPDDPEKAYQRNGKYVVNEKFVTDGEGNPVKVTDAETGEAYYQTVPIPAETFTYYLRDGDENFDPVPHTAADGVFWLRHDQTAMIVGIEADAKYLVTESSDPAYNLLDENARVVTARGETVDDAGIRSRAPGSYELFVNERDELKGLVLTKKVIDSDSRLNQQAEFTFRLEKLEGTEYVPVRNMPYAYKDGADSYRTGETTDENGYFKVRCNINNFLVKFPEARGTFRITEVDPNDWDDQNNSVGTAAPNPRHEDHLYYTEVHYVEYTVAPDTEPVQLYDHGTVTYNADPDVHTDDIVISGVSCLSTRAATVDFTNCVRDMRYYFSLEKLAYLDDNIHKQNADTTQRFLYRIERFDTMEQACDLNSTALETFYTDLSCTEKFTVNSAGSYTSGTDAYPYQFYPINYSYTGRSGMTGGDSVRYDETEGIVTRNYRKADTDRVYENNKQEEYKFFSTIYRGERQIAVAKQGFYRITEVTDWSGTDYDYCLKSNRYKGYLDSEEAAKSRLFADCTTNAALTHSVVIRVGALADTSQTPYTLGCEFFDEASEQQGTVRYVKQVLENGNPVVQYVQKRSANGDLLYYVTGQSGETTVQKYAEDGTRRSPVIAPLRDFREQETLLVDGTELPLYYDAEHTQPIFRLATEDKNFFETEVVDGEGETQTKLYTTVYDENGTAHTVVPGYYKLAAEHEDNEAYYTHSDNQFGLVYETVETKDALRPMASFSNVESEYAFLSSGAWAENRAVRPTT